MQERKRSLPLAVLGAAGAILSVIGLRAAFTTGSGSWHSAELVLLLAIFNLVFWILRVPIGRGSVSVGGVVSYLSIGLLGPWPAIGLKLPGILASTLWLKADWRRKATVLGVNLAVMGTTLLLAGWTYVLLGGHYGAALTASALPPYLAMSAAYTVSNVGLLALVNGLTSGQVVWGAFRDGLRQFWLNALLFALVGYLSGLMYVDLGLAGLLLAFAALLATRFTFQLYAANQRTRSELAGVLAKALRYKDPYTAEHSHRVAAQAVLIGQQLGLSDQELETLHDAALLHDIGKVAVPDALLVKPGPLDLAEWERMERHVGAGGELLEESPHLKNLADFVRLHHTHTDEDTPPLIARIIAVADAFDAMTSDRPYRKALPLDEAVRRLQAGVGGQFDGAVVEAWLRCLTSGRADLPLAPEIGGPAAGDAAGQ